MFFLHKLLMIILIYDAFRLYLFDIYMLLYMSIEQPKVILAELKTLFMA